MPTPLISVILPFRNAESTLAAAIESLLSQTLASTEILLIDNASSDSSPYIAQNYVRTNSSIRLLHEDKVGLVAALNKGLAHTSGQYIARMDADDIALPQRLALQAQYLEQHAEVGVLACQVAVQQNTTAGLRNYIRWSNALLTHEQIALNRFVDSPIIHPSVMFRHSLIQQYGPYRTGDLPEDFELWLRWLEQGVRFHKIDQKLLFWRDSPGRLTRTHSRYRWEAFYKLKAEYLYTYLHKHNPYHPKVMVWGAGRKSRQRLRFLEEKGIEVTAYIDIVEGKTSTLPCIHYSKIEPPGKHFILSNVSNRGQRQKIRTYLLEKGYQEGKDFLLMA
ncbi:glycosyltransferase [Porifericola rhodea]|uniref:glycosyltransferase family 2 protein n=1 Tax=Porifericola rhodea TaxID=930972 RepID=UPI0026654605|nr:glycosyltransferase [Porifericola rhodea]WKN29851.1 glycosyltransferase [Porifericola rhodea]